MRLSGALERLADVEAVGRHLESFARRLSRRQSLAPGTYRLTLAARDGEGARSARKRASFRLLRATRTA